MSMASAPVRIAGSAAFSPVSQTRSTVASSGRQVMTTSHCAANSAGVAASRAPSSTSASIGGRLRLCTTSG